MARRKSIYGNSFGIEETENVAIEEMPIQVYNQSETKLRVRFPARIKTTGQSSGKPYDVMPGEVFFALNEDVEGLLGRKIGERTCCGGQAGGNYLFELA
jgi:hypothetical protein